MIKRHRAVRTKLNEKRVINICAEIKQNKTWKTAHQWDLKESGWTTADFPSKIVKPPYPQMAEMVDVTVLDRMQRKADDNALDTFDIEIKNRSFYTLKAYSQSRLSMGLQGVQGNDFIEYLKQNESLYTNDNQYLEVRERSKQIVNSNKSTQFIIWLSIEKYHG